MFRPFLNWSSSGWNTVQEELYNYYNIIIRGGGRDLVYKMQGVCADRWWKLDTCINHVGIVCPLCWLERMGLATLVSGGVTVVCRCGRGHPEMNDVAAAGVCCCGRGPILRVGELVLVFFDCYSLIMYLL
jgi:hypothetical protein